METFALHTVDTWAFEERHLNEVESERDALQVNLKNFVCELITCSREFNYYLIKLR